MNILKKKWIYIVFVLSVLLFSTLPSILTDWCHEEQYICEQAQDTPPAMVRLSKKTIKQTISLCYKPTKIGIYFKNTPGGGYDAQVTISQNNIIFEKNLKISSEGFYYIESDDIAPGKFTISISANEDDCGAVLLSTDLSFGTLNGEDESLYSLLLDITTKRDNPYRNLKILLLSISITISILTCLLLWKWTNTENNLSKKQSSVIFLLSIGIITLQICCKFAFTIFSNNAYYETAGLYINNIKFGGISGFLMDDAGYLPLFPRIISFVCIKIFHILKYAPLIYELVTVVIIAGIFAFFLTKPYEQLLDIRIRFLIIIISGCSQLILVNSQIVLFFNVSYYGALLMMMIYLLDLEQQSKKIIPWCILSGLMLMSKGAYLVFAPLLLIFWVICLIKKKMKTALYTFFLGCMLSIQCFYVLFGPVKEHALSIGSIKDLFYIFINSIWIYFSSFLKIIFTNRSGINSYFLITLTIIINFIIFVYSRRLFCKHFGYMLLFLQIAAFLQILLNQAGAGRSQVFTNETQTGFFNLSEWPNYAYEKNVFLLFVLIWYLLLICIIQVQKIKENEKQHHYSILAGIIVFLLFRSLLICSEEKYDTDNLKNWGAYSHQILFDSYAIPSTGNKFIAKNAYISYIGTKEQSFNVYRGSYGVNEAQKQKNKLTFYYALPDTDTTGLIAIYAQKSFIAQPNNIYCVLVDESGKEIMKLKATTQSHLPTKSIAFIFNIPIQNCKYVKFFNEFGKPITLQNDSYFVYQK